MGRQNYNQPALNIEELIQLIRSKNIIIDNVKQASFYLKIVSYHFSILKGGLAGEALKFYAKLYVIEKEAREKNLQPDERHQLRFNKTPLIWDAFKKWLEHHLPKTSEQGKIGKAIRYCLKHWTELTNYLLDGKIEIDNNLVENAIRPFALGRKNWLFSGSPAGAKAGALFYSLIETCKANNVELYQYFCTMSHRIRFCKSEEDYRYLLPQFIKF